jgi:hypothetical protein
MGPVRLRHAVTGFFLGPGYAGSIQEVPGLQRAAGNSLVRGGSIRIGLGRFIWQQRVRGTSSTAATDTWLQGLLVAFKPG